MLSVTKSADSRPADVNASSLPVVVVAVSAVSDAGVMTSSPLHGGMIHVRRAHPTIDHIEAKLPKKHDRR